MYNTIMVLRLTYDSAPAFTQSPTVKYVCGWTRRRSTSCHRYCHNTNSGNINTNSTVKQNVQYAVWKCSMLQCRVLCVL